MLLHIPLTLVCDCKWLTMQEKLRLGSSHPELGLPYGFHCVAWSQVEH